MTDKQRIDILEARCKRYRDLIKEHIPNWDDIIFNKHAFGKMTPNDILYLHGMPEIEYKDKPKPSFANCKNYTDDCLLPHIIELFATRAGRSIGCIVNCEECNMYNCEGV